MASMSHRELVGRLLSLPVATRPTFLTPSEFVSVSSRIPLRCKRRVAAEHVLRYLGGSVGLKLAILARRRLTNLQVTKHPGYQSAMKHVHRAYHWIRDHVDFGLITDCMGSLTANLGYYYVIRSITYITLSLANPVPNSILLLYHKILTTHVQLSTRLSPSI